MKNEPCSCLTCSGYCSCGLSGHHIQITDMEPEGFSQVTVTSNPPNQSRDSQIDSNDPKKKVLLFNHGKGGEIEVSMIEDILYNLSGVAGCPLNIYLCGGNQLLFASHWL